MKRIFIIAVTLLILTLPLAAQTQRMKLPGMNHAGTITRDANGIPHIWALNEYDMAVLQGWVHAEDRFFQIDFNRRIAYGTLAELVGPSALGNDVQLRVIGLGRAAQKSHAALSPETAKILEGYAAGVNAWLRSNPLPMEYGLLEITQVAPWQPMDSVVMTKLIAFGLSFDLDIDNTITLLTYQGVGAVANFNGTALFFEDLFRSEPFSSASTVPDASGVDSTVAMKMSDGPGFDYSQVTRDYDPALLDLAKGYLKELRSNEYLQSAIGRDSFKGSNEWAVSGNLTSTGRPMMANDPHLALGSPSTFYPIVLQAGKINCAGIGFAGVPYVVLGSTDRVTWGATVNPMDVTDVYQEQLVPGFPGPVGLASLYKGELEGLFAVPQQWRMNIIGNNEMNSVVPVPASFGLPGAALIIPRKNAPILSVDFTTGIAISLQYTGLGATTEIETFRIWNRAQNLDDFRQGLKHFDFGSQNWTYMDVDGNIAYFTSGEMPIREDLQAGRVDGAPPWLIRNGQGGNDWIPLSNPPENQATLAQILPASEMPHVINPPNGWFVNANNDPAGTTLDNNPLNQLRPGGGIFYLNPGYDGFRAGRITEVLQAKLAEGPITLDDMKEIQGDVTLIDAEFFVPYILTALSNAKAEGAHPVLAGAGADPFINAAVARLAAWDFSTPTGIPQGFDFSDVNGQPSLPSDEEIANSVAATIYSVWRGQFVKNTIDALLDGISTLAGVEMPKPDSGLTMAALRHHLENYETARGIGASGLPMFTVPGVADRDAVRDILILASLGDALKLIVGDEFAPAFGKSLDMNTWNWGKLHRIVFAHQLGSILNVPPAGGGFPAPLEGLPGIPTDGGFGVPDASSHSVRADSVNEFMFGSGPARRFIGEGLVDRIHHEMGFPGGASGVIGNENYLTMLPIWLTNDYIELTLPLIPRLPWLGR